MNEGSDLVSGMLAVACCAVLLVASQQYLLKQPENILATSARPNNLAGARPPFVQIGKRGNDQTSPQAVLVGLEIGNR